MRLLRRQRRGPQAKTGRPAERFLAAGADEARRLGHSSVGTEHVLLALTRDPGSGAATILRQLDVSHGDVAESHCLAGTPTRRLDADALATLGIDLDSVRERLAETFGPGALEHTRAGCLAVMPRLKMALAYAVDYAEEGPVQDEHMLLGLLSVPNSLAATSSPSLASPCRGSRRSSRVAKSSSGVARDRSLQVGTSSTREIPVNIAIRSQPATSTVDDNSNENEIWHLRALPRGPELNVCSNGTSTRGKRLLTLP